MWISFLFTSGKHHKYIVLLKIGNDPEETYLGDFKYMNQNLKLTLLSYYIRYLGFFSVH